MVLYLSQGMKCNKDTHEGYLEAIGDLCHDEVFRQKPEESLPDSVWEREHQYAECHHLSHV